MGKYSTAWNLMTEFHCSLSFMLQISKIRPKLSLRDCNIPSFRWVNKIDQYELDESENDATKKGKFYLIDMVVKNYKMMERAKDETKLPNMFLKSRLPLVSDINKEHYLHNLRQYRHNYTCISICVLQEYRCKVYKMIYYSKAFPFSRNMEAW